MTRPSSPLATMIGQTLTQAALVPILTHFAEQRRTNRIFFIEPIRSLWVKCLAGLIEPRLARLVRHARGRPIVPLSLIATELAEAEIGLITTWLTTKPLVKTETIAEALLASTRAMTAALLRLPSEALIIPGEKLRVLHGYDQLAPA